MERNVILLEEVCTEKMSFFFFQYEKTEEYNMRANQ